MREEKKMMTFKVDFNIYLELQGKFDLPEDTGIHWKYEQQFTNSLWDRYEHFDFVCAGGELTHDETEVHLGWDGEGVEMDITVTLWIQSDGENLLKEITDVRNGLAHDFRAILRLDRDDVHRVLWHPFKYYKMKIEKRES